MAADVVYYYCSPCPFEFYFFRFFLLCFFFLDYPWGLQTISLCSAVFVCVTSGSPESDLDLELRGGGGTEVSCPLPCRLFFLLPSFFLFFLFTQIEGGRGGWASRPPPLDPPLVTVKQTPVLCSHKTFFYSELQNTCCSPEQDKLTPLYKLSPYWVAHVNNTSLK